MASIQKSNYTICEAFDIVGKRMYGLAWIGKETRIIRQRVVKPADDFKSPPHISDEELVRRITADSGSEEIGRAMEMALRNSMGEDISIDPELPQFVDIECEIHREADAQRRPAPEDARRAIAYGHGEPHWPPWDSPAYLEQHEAWVRHEGAKSKLRQIMSEYPIKSWSRTPGEDIVISPANWVPDYLDFDINVSAGFCGDTHHLAEWGEGLIDRADFDIAIEAEFPVESGAGEEGEDNPPGPTPYILSIWKMIEVVEEVDGPLTTNVAITYFTRMGKHKIHDDFVGAQLVGETITWADSSNVNRKMKLRTLQGHRRDYNAHLRAKTESAP